jgi:hypothetical protein
MKIVLASGVILLAAACSPAPASETAAPADAPSIAPPPAPMAPPQIVMQTSLVGRWGVTMDACAPASASKDGVIEITLSTVAMGLDACTISSAEPEGAGMMIVLQCKSGEGAADYERNFSVVSSTPETMTWVKEGDEGEPYVRCP